MSITCFPAPVGTYLLTRVRGEKFATKIPVIGYLHIQAGVAFPLTVMPGGGLTLGRVLVTPDGFVSDPAFGVACETVDEWMKLSDTAPYWEREPETKGAYTQAMTEQFTEEQRALSDGHTTGAAPDLADAAHSDPGPKSRIPDKPAAPAKPARTFKTNSYWKFQKNPKKHDSAWDCVWMIPGGQPVPPEKGSPYEKITGEEYKALKKAEWPEADPRNDPPAGKPTMKPVVDDDDTSDIL